MRFLPVFLDVAAGTVALVGFGPEAQNKLRLLRAAGARVHWYAGAERAETAAAEAAEKARASQASVEIIASDPIQAKFSGYMAVVSAAGDAIDAAVAARARAAGIPVNVVDRPDLSTFIVPAIIDRGEVLVAVGTGGASPVLARRLRERIEALLPARIGDLAALLGRFRTRFAQKRHGSRSARRFWEHVVDGPIGSLALAGRLDEAEAALAQAVEASAAPESSSAFIYLLDAGPGEPDLLTLRALQALQNADVIVYDQQVDPAVLDRARRDAERIVIGRRRGQPEIRADAVASLLAEHARAGRNVALLSGRKTFTDALFCRLRQAGLSVNVVPGVAAASTDSTETLEIAA
jgi:uroporphyrin-III C-methyltransferase/precorrin-2 dehydrogenase/sirohydrochlorin ferrochelatase